MIIYTDGACSGNPGKGGWAWVLYHNNQYKAYCGHHPATTNNQMEMQAILEALSFIVEQKLLNPITICSDSAYAINGLTEWVKGWKKKGWINAAKQPVKNKELWEKLDYAFSRLPNVQLQWVKGHSTNVGNNIADMIACCKMHQHSLSSCKCHIYLAKD